jgi:hypothetical protein
VRRESFDVPIILRGIQLKGFARKFASLPILVKRVLEQVLRCDGGVKSGKQFAVGHGAYPLERAARAKRITRQPDSKLPHCSKNSRALL